MLTEIKIRFIGLYDNGVGGCQACGDSGQSYLTASQTAVYWFPDGAEFTAEKGRVYTFIADQDGIMRAEYLLSCHQTINGRIYSNFERVG